MDRLFNFLLKKAESSRKKVNKKYLENILLYLAEIMQNIASLRKTESYVLRSAVNGNLSARDEDVEHFLSNYYLWWYVLNEKIYQLINTVYLELDETNFSLKREIDNHRKTKKFKPVLLHLRNHPDIKIISQARKKLTHLKNSRILDIDRLRHYAPDKRKEEYVNLYIGHKILQIQRTTEFMSDSIEKISNIIYEDLSISRKLLPD